MVAEFVTAVAAFSCNGAVRDQVACRTLMEYADRSLFFAYGISDDTAPVCGGIGLFRAAGACGMALLVHQNDVLFALTDEAKHLHFFIGQGFVHNFFGVLIGVGPVAEKRAVFLADIAAHEIETFGLALAQ